MSEFDRMTMDDVMNTKRAQMYINKS